MIGLFAKFPIKVVIFKRYGNAIRVVFDRARVIRREETTKDGVRKLEFLKLKKEKAQIPLVDIKHYFDIENERYVYLYQPERNVYIPCKVTQDYISINLVTHEKDENGNVVTKLVEVPVFLPRIETEEITKKDLRTIYINEILRAQERWKKVSFWERWGGLLMLIMMLIFGIMIFVTAYHQYANIIGSASESLERVAEALNKVADKLTQTQNASIITPPPLAPPY
jgi:hypothetical protein